MRPTTVTVGPLTGASANNIALAQAPTSAFTLNGSTVTGGIAVLDTARRVLFTTTDDESANTATITGTDVNGQVQTDVVALTSSSTSYSAIDFKTVIRIVLASAAGANITVGTNGVASSRWMRMDEYAQSGAAIQAIVTGTVNYTVQVTMQDPDSPFVAVPPYQVVWSSHPDPNFVGATTTQFGAYTDCPLWTRVLLNSGTGSVSTTIAQFSDAPY